MTTYYVQVEAVNLAHIVYDTSDLSTIRGGSFILLDAIRKLADSPSFRGQLRPVSTAASQGLFTVNTDASIDPLLQGISEHLYKYTGDHATFLVAAHEDIPGRFPEVLERLSARIRRQQWRMPTVAVPPPLPSDGCATECFLDGWRPGVHDYTVGDTVSNAKISAATHYRRRVGRTLKHDLFAELLDGVEYNDNLCAKDLGALAADPSKGVLNGKIAFIHVDGNCFGHIRRSLCTDAEKRRQFDIAIQNGCREPFLADLLKLARSDPDFKTKDDRQRDALRIEVLLWGGDEMTLVVPAWKGWQTLDLFYQHASALSFDGAALSHRAALIFCHHNAPLLQIRRLAEDLLGRAKKDIQASLENVLVSSPDLVVLSEEQRSDTLASISNHRYGNAAHYLSLESFDMLRGSIDTFLSEYYQGIEYAELLIFAHEFAQLGHDLRTISANMQRGKLLEIVAALHMGEMERVQALKNQMLGTVTPQHVQVVRRAIDAVTADKPGRWHLVADLWDYISEWGVV